MDIVQERSLLDSTIEMLGYLNNEELAAIQSVARAFISKSSEEEHYRPLTEEELTARIDASLADIAAGRYKDADVVVAELRKEFGL